MCEGFGYEFNFLKIKSHSDYLFLLFSDLCFEGLCPFLPVVKCIVIKIYNIPLLSFRYFQDLCSDASSSFLILVIFYKTWCEGPLMSLTLKRQHCPLWPSICKASGGPFKVCFYLGEPDKESCYKMNELQVLASM